MGVRNATIVIAIWFEPRLSPMLTAPCAPHAEAGLRPADIYGGPNGALAQLKRLEAWFAAQRDFCFYSSSVLIIYEVQRRCNPEADPEPDPTCSPTLDLTLTLAHM